MFRIELFVLLEILELIAQIIHSSPESHFHYLKSQKIILFRDSPKPWKKFTPRF